jgi:hypothetical protein
MAQKYEHLVKPLSIGLVDWEKIKKGKNKESAVVVGPGNAGQEIWLNGRDHLEGMNLNFSWGIRSGTGDWHSGLDPHVHPYAECLYFVGLDSANINYLGVEIDVCLGEELETYSFSEPTVVVVPAGLPHGPIITRRIYSPRGFGFFAAELSAVNQPTWLGESTANLSAEQKKTLAVGNKIIKNSPAKATGKYAHLVKPLKAGIMTQRGKFNPARFTPEQLAQREEANKKRGQKLGPGNADHLTWMYGRDLEDLNVNILWGFYSSPGLWHRGVGAHVHPVDEILIYLGTDPNNLDYLGAEIEMDLGAEHERYIINKPTVVICPAGVPHNPQVTRWVDRPYAFLGINLSSEHETKSFD